MRVDKENSTEIMQKNINHEVCIFSLEKLPKQIALAKLFRSVNITGILKVQYKGPNKVFVELETKNDALKLLDCQQFKEMGCRCQLTYEVSISRW